MARSGAIAAVEMRKAFAPSLAPTLVISMEKRVAAPTLALGCEAAGCVPPPKPAERSPAGLGQPVVATRWAGGGLAPGRLDETIPAESAQQWIDRPLARHHAVHLRERRGQRPFPEDEAEEVNGGLDTRDLYRFDVGHRSALTLRGLCHEHSGAILAAAGLLLTLWREPRRGRRRGASQALP
mgnify:CR=1 FL=1